MGPYLIQLQQQAAAIITIQYHRAKLSTTPQCSLMQVRIVADAICQTMETEEIVWFTPKEIETADQQQKLGRGFYMPGCIGGLDGRHTPCAGGGSRHGRQNNKNYYGEYSVNALTICDHRCVIKWDSGIFSGGLPLLCLFSCFIGVYQFHFWFAQQQTAHNWLL
jgi:hypothetical protein